MKISIFSIYKAIILISCILFGIVVFFSIISTSFYNHINYICTYLFQQCIDKKAGFGYWFVNIVSIIFLLGLCFEIFYRIVKCFKDLKLKVKDKE
jgi:hypothetical protein